MHESSCDINKISRVLNGISIKKQTPYFQSASVIIEPKYLNWRNEERQ